MTLPEASRKAIHIIRNNPDMGHLYQKAVRSHGEGELHCAVLDLMVEALNQDKTREEVFATRDSLLSFCCGFWVQYLLTEVAGLQRRHLKDIANKVFRTSDHPRVLH